MTEIIHNSVELTNHQLGIWLESKIHPNTAIHNIGTFVKLNGVPNGEVLSQAISNVIQENDGMRLRISRDKGSSTQFFPKSRPFTLIIKDFGSNSNSTDLAIEWMNSEFIKPININDDELYHIALVKCGGGNSYIFFKLHHICTDGLSFALMISNISNHYNALLKGETFTNPSSYGDYSKKLLKNRSSYAEENSKLYWKKRFEDFERVSVFSKKQRLAKNVHSQRRELTIDKKTIKSIRLPEIPFEKGLFYYLLAIFYITISRAKGINELVIGLPLLNRNGPEEMNTLGFFVSVIPLRLSFGNDSTFEEVVNGIRAELRDNYSFRNISIHDINKVLGVNISNSTHLYDVVFSFETFKRDVNFGSHKVTNSGTFSSGYEQLPLVLHVQDFNEFDDVNFEFDHNLNYLSSDQARVLISRFKNVLHHFIGNTKRSIGSSPILLEEERITLKGLGDGLKRELSCNNILDPILKKSTERANQVILTDELGSLTYSELLYQAKRLAAHLISIGVESGEAIAIIAPRAKESIVNILGVLLSGACYVPIDPCLKAGRICTMLNLASVKRIVVHEGFQFKNSYANFSLIEKEKLEDSFDYQKPTLTEKSLAYIIFTSGTTGKPKGVKITHGSVVNLIDGLAQEVYLNYSDQGKLALLSPFNFDASVQQLFASLMLGRELVIVPSEVRKDGELIMRFYDENEIEISDGIPTHVLSMITRTPCLSKNSKLRHLIIGGEVFDIELAKTFFKWCDEKNVKISNVYGPTECTVDSSFFTFDKNTLSELTSIPIGRPMQNARILILDENNQLLPLQEKGEICIGGNGLSAGYVNGLTLTKEKFIFHPELGETLYHSGDIGRWGDDGFLYFLGRKDNQVKVRGYRIELAEIEYWLNQIESVEQSVVLIKNKGAKKIIIGYVQSKEELKGSKIKELLSENLPSYMIPHFVNSMRALPVTSTGKIDRKLLLLSENNESIAEHNPQTKTELKLTDIMREVLDIKTIDVEASFFAQGGDSLGVVSLLVKIEEEFNTSISMSQFGLMNSVRKIARFLESKYEVEETPISLDDELGELGFLNPTQCEPRTIVDSKKAFITGGTGFIGSFLIQEACKFFDIVYCLVRAKDRAEGKARLEKRLQSYQLSGINWKKIVVIPGELSENRLGMSMEDWGELSGVDYIYHSGAMVNFVKDFESMKQVNVNSVYSLLKLCYIGRPKKFNYISTKGVFTSDIDNYFENDDLESQIHYKSRGYEATKWLSDVLTNKARSAGIQSNIFRLGRITGESQNGIARFEDFFYRFMEGCIELKCFPKELLDLSTNLTPVNLTAESIIKLSLRSGGKNYHISNNKFTSYRGIIDTCSELNYDLDIVSYSDWFERVELLNQENQGNPFFLISSILKQKTWFEADKNELNSTSTNQILQKEGVVWPHGNDLWNVYVAKCISHVRDKII